MGNARVRRLPGCRSTPSGTAVPGLPRFQPRPTAASRHSLMLAPVRAVRRCSKRRPDRRPRRRGSTLTMAVAVSWRRWLAFTVEAPLGKPTTRRPRSPRRWWGGIATRRRSDCCSEGLHGAQPTDRRAHHQRDGSTPPSGCWPVRGRRRGGEHSSQQVPTRRPRQFGDAALLRLPVVSSTSADARRSRRRQMHGGGGVAGDCNRVSVDAAARPCRVRGRLMCRCR